MVLGVLPSAPTRRNFGSYTRKIDRREFVQRAAGVALGTGAFGALTGFRPETASGPFRELAREIQGSVVTPSSAGYKRDKVLVDRRFE